MKRTIPALTGYPLMKCGSGTHGNRRRGYAICIHVLGGDPVGVVIPPTATSIGQVLCMKDAHKVDEAHLVCELCALEKGWLVAAKCAIYPS